MLAALAGFAAATAADRPNFLVIVADDPGYGDLSVQGAAEIRTPHIDGIFSGGMRFDRFHSNSTVCSPTRAALLSGRYPDRAGVPGVIREHEGGGISYGPGGQVASRYSFSESSQ